MIRPSLRRSVDALGAVFLVALLIGAAGGNYYLARRARERRPQSLHIAVAAARHLDAGTILRQEDLAVRVKRVVDMNHAFDDSQRLVGRQLQRPIDRDAAITDADLVDLARSRRPRGTFFIVVDAQNAGCIAPGQNVVLVPRKESTATTAPSSMPVFRVEAISDVPPEKDKPVSQRRIQLSADYAQDASSVLAQADGTHYIPVVIGDAPIPCPPPPRTPPATEKERSATARRQPPQAPRS